MTPEEQLLWDIFSNQNREKKEMDIKEARRKSFDVKYVVVTTENIEEVAAWCGGEIGGEGAGRFVKVTDKNAISSRQTKAFVDDYVLKMSETGTSFKAFTEKSFKKSYEPYPNDLLAAKDFESRKVARSAKSGQFVSHDEAEANPDTTVVEKIKLEGVPWTGETEVRVEEVEAHPEALDGPKHGQPYWEVHDDETVYFNAVGETITKAEFDAWGS